LVGLQRHVGSLAQAEPVAYLPLFRPLAPKGGRRPLLPGFGAGEGSAPRAPSARPAGAVRFHAGFAGSSAASLPVASTPAMEAIRSPWARDITRTPSVARLERRMLSTPVRSTIPSSEMSISSRELSTIFAAATGPVLSVTLKPITPPPPRPLLGK